MASSSRAAWGVSALSARHAGPAEQVYELLKEELLTQQIAPGEPLHIPMLARRLALPQAPVREALARLAAERLVAGAPSRGYVAASLPDASRLADIFDVRSLLEGHAARVGAGRWTASQRERLRGLHSAMFRLHGRAAAPADLRAFREFAQLNQQFHLLIVEVAGNAVLADVCRTLGYVLHVTQLAYGLGVRDAGMVCAEHGRIVAALESGEKGATEAAVAAHITARKTRVLHAARAQVHGADGPPGRA